MTVKLDNPWPGVYFKHEGKTIKILSAEYTEKNHQEKPGTLLGNNFEVACGQGTLIIRSIKPSGKTEMQASDYLRGFSNLKLIPTLILN